MKAPAGPHFDNHGHDHHPNLPGPPKVQGPGVEQLVIQCAGDPKKLAQLLATLEGSQRAAAIEAAHKLFGNAFVDQALHPKNEVGGNTVGGSQQSGTSLGKGGFDSHAQNEMHAGGFNAGVGGSTHIGPDGASRHDTFSAGGKSVTIGGSIDAEKMDPSKMNSTFGGNTVGGSQQSGTSLGKGGFDSHAQNEMHAGGFNAGYGGSTHVGPDGASRHDTFNAGGKSVTIGGSIDTKSFDPNHTTVGGNTVGSSHDSGTSLGKGGFDSHAQNEMHAGRFNAGYGGSTHVGPDGASRHDTFSAGGKSVTIGGSIDKKSLDPNHTTVGGNTVGSSHDSGTSLGKGGFDSHAQNEMHAGGFNAGYGGSTHVGPDGASRHDTFSAGGKSVTVGGSVDANSLAAARSRIETGAGNLRSSATNLMVKAATLSNAVGSKAGDVASKLIARAGELGHDATAQGTDAATLAKLEESAAALEGLQEVIPVVLDVLAAVAPIVAMIPMVGTPIAAALGIVAGIVGNARTREEAGRAVSAARDALSAANNAAANAANSAANAATDAAGNAVGAAQNAASNAGSSAGNAANDAKKKLGF